MPPAAVAVGLVWATHYVWSTSSNPYDEPEAAWLIRPLLIALWIVGPFVIWSAKLPLPEKLVPDPAESLALPSRRVFLAGLALFAAGIWLLGFVAAIAIYTPLMCRALGERRLSALICATVLLLAILWGGFHYGLDIRLPLWPVGFR